MYMCVFIYVDSEHRNCSINAVNKCQARDYSFVFVHSVYNKGVIVFNSAHFGRKIFCCIVKQYRVHESEPI